MWVNFYSNHMNFLYQNVQGKFCYIENLFEVETSILVANPVNSVMVHLVYFEKEKDTLIPKHSVLFRPHALLFPNV